VTLADCLIAWWGKGDGSNEARAAAVVVAEFITLVRGALKKK